MRTLAINTGFAAIEAVLVCEGELVGETRRDMPRGQDQYLPSVVADLLKECGVALTDLTRLAVVTGPGSFTGLRVGVSYLRAMALALDVPCIGVTALEASVPLGMETSVLAALQAKKRPPDQTWWTQGIGPNGAGIADVLEVTRSELSDMLVGFKVPVFIDETRGLGIADMIDVRPLVPSALTAALKAEVFDPDKHVPRPIYARAPDAALPAAKTAPPI